MPDTSELTDTELHDKITKVLDRLNFAGQMGHSESYRQLNNIYQALVLEQQDRIAKNYIKEDLDDPFEGLINIKK